jgi:hypothetical protein
VVEFLKLPPAHTTRRLKELEQGLYVVSLCIRHSEHPFFLVYRQTHILKLSLQSYTTLKQICCKLFELAVGDLVAFFLPLEVDPSFSIADRRHVRRALFSVVLPVVDLELVRLFPLASIDKLCYDWFNTLTLHASFL